MPKCLALAAQAVLALVVFLVVVHGMPADAMDFISHRHDDRGLLGLVHGLLEAIQSAASDPPW
jgi:hypothetical protein